MSTGEIIEHSILFPTAMDDCCGKDIMDIFCGNVLVTDVADKRESSPKEIVNVPFHKQNARLAVMNEAMAQLYESLGLDESEDCADD